MWSETDDERVERIYGEKLPVLCILSKKPEQDKRDGSESADGEGGTYSEAQTGRADRDLLVALLKVCQTTEKGLGRHIGSIYLFGSSVIGKEGADVDIYVPRDLNYSDDMESAYLGVEQERRNCLAGNLRNSGIKLKHDYVYGGFSNQEGQRLDMYRYGHIYEIRTNGVWLVDQERNRTQVMNAQGEDVIPDEKQPVSWQGALNAAVVSMLAIVAGLATLYGTRWVILLAIPALLLPVYMYQVYDLTRTGHLRAGPLHDFFEGAKEIDDENESRLTYVDNGTLYANKVELKKRPLLVQALYANHERFELAIPKSLSKIWLARKLWGGLAYVMQFVYAGRIVESIRLKIALAREYKAVILDIDRVLTDDSGDMPEDVVDWIVDGISEGKLIVLASGRMLDLSENNDAEKLRENGINDIKDDVFEKIRARLKERGIDESALGRLWAVPENGCFAVNGYPGSHSEREKKPLVDIRFARGVQEEVAAYCARLEGFPEVTLVEHKRGGISLNMDPGEVAKAGAIVREKLKEKVSIDLNVVETHSTIDIDQADIQKMKAVDFIRDSFGISEKHIATVGDKANKKGNDYSMVNRRSGFSVNEYDPSSPMVPVSVATGRKCLDAARYLMRRFKLKKAVTPRELFVLPWIWSGLMDARWKWYFETDQVLMKNAQICKNALEDETVVFELPDEWTGKMTLPWGHTLGDSLKREGYRQVYDKGSVSEPGEYFIEAFKKEGNSFKSGKLHVKLIRRPTASPAPLLNRLGDWFVGHPRFMGLLVITVVAAVLPLLKGMIETCKPLALTTSYFPWAIGFSFGVVIIGNLLVSTGLYRIEDDKLSDPSRAEPRSKSLLNPFGPLKMVWKTVNRTQRIQIVLIGVMIQFIAAILCNYSLLFIATGAFAVLIQLTHIGVMVLAALFLGEKITSRKVAGNFGIIAGIWWFTYIADKGLAMSPLGIGLVVVASMVNAVRNILIKKLFNGIHDDTEMEESTKKSAFAKSSLRDH